MRLAFGLGQRHQIGIGDVAGFEHRTGDGNIVIGGKLVDDAGRRIGNGRQAAREFGQCLRFDLDDQGADDVVEQRDMVVIELRARRRETGR